ncbi:hydroxyacylglutathione hydrolase [Chitinibacter tainanensis]|uniref:hydroxyacylglutathione hydrolase n=1 Tax=Chitinibacter tainanensis TaxID=230667 RepID=UPI0003F9E5B9|nr:hydroxyacylglutathione hydrolase [Chitinibacter tainanensis]
MLTLTALPIFSDNYIWLLHNEQAVIAVDPGAAAPLQAWLTARGAQLAGILITHHHHDHTGGLAALASPALPIYGPAGVAEVNRPLVGGESFTLLETPIEVIATPGHTLDHLSYLVADRLFCGDTLFSAGCGRLFEGTPAQMLASLQRLAALPAPTQVCCTHEYTASNLRFARHLEPENAALAQREAEVLALRAAGKASLPSNMGLELATNPFLRCGEAPIQAAAQRFSPGISGELATFTALREWKNQF